MGHPIHNFGLDGDVESNPGPPKKVQKKIANKIEEVKKKVDKVERLEKRIERRIIFSSKHPRAWQNHPIAQAAFRMRSTSWPHATMLDAARDFRVPLDSVKHPSTDVAMRIRRYQLTSRNVVDLAADEYLVFVVNPTNLGADTIPINNAVPSMLQPATLRPFAVYRGTSATHATPVDQLTPVTFPLSGQYASTVDGAGTGTARCLGLRWRAVSASPVLNLGGLTYESAPANEASFYGFRVSGTSITPQSFTSYTYDAIRAATSTITSRFTDEATGSMVTDQTFRPLVNLMSNNAGLREVGGASVNTEIGIMNQDFIPRLPGQHAPQGWTYFFVLHPAGTTGLTTSLSITVEALMEEERFSPLAASSEAASATQPIVPNNALVLADSAASNYLSNAMIMLREAATFGGQAMSHMGGAAGIASIVGSGVAAALSGYGRPATSYPMIGGSGVGAKEWV